MQNTLVNLNKHAYGNKEKDTDDHTVENPDILQGEWTMVFGMRGMGGACLQLPVCWNLPALHPREVRRGKKGQQGRARCRRLSPVAEFRCAASS